MNSVMQSGAGSRPSVSVAIIGAGPSGFYCADALIKTGIDFRIDIIESLPTPFGLIRAGVAPDHQSTKRVTRAYERTALDEHVGYYGNVQVGRDISIGQLRNIYDAVVVAVGAPLDRDLDIPGGQMPGVYGSAAFVGWYNGHPDHRDLDPDLSCRTVAVIGNGNVALDVARVLVKTPGEMAHTDLPDYAARAIHGAPIQDVYLFGRRGPLDAKFTNVELRELGQLEDCHPMVDAAQLPEEVADGMPDRERRLKKKNLATLHSFLTLDPAGKRKRLHLTFYSRPVEVLGRDRVEGLRLERTRLEAGQPVGTGEFFDIACGAVIAAIGTRSQPLEGLPFDKRKGAVVNREGRVADGLYVVGWAKRGPTGVIGSNKPDGDLIARHILADLPAGSKPGRPALEAWLQDRGVDWVSFADWKTIEAAEIEAAGPCAPRKKLIRIKDMLDVLHERRPPRTARKCKKTEKTLA